MGPDELSSNQQSKNLGARHAPSPQRPLFTRRQLDARGKRVGGTNKNSGPFLPVVHQTWPAVCCGLQLTIAGRPQKELKFPHSSKNYYRLLFITHTHKSQ
eukprot:4954029-Amphidinium_carterae.3